MRWQSRWGAPKLSEHTEDYQPTIWQKVIDTAEALVKVAELVVLARGPLRPLDMAAIGMRTMHSGLEVYRTWSREEQIDLQAYFRGDDGTFSDWKYVSPYIAKMAFNGLEIREEPIPGYQREKNGKIVESAWTATIEECEIGWVGPPNENSVPDGIWSKNPRLVSDLASKRLWDLAGDDKIIRLLGGGEPTPHELPRELVETSFLRDVKTRVDAFLRADVPRSIILNGEPGVGKTTCAGWVARALGYRTIVVEASDFVGAQGGLVPDENGLHIAAGLTLAQLMKPEVLVVNDIDRLDQEDQIKLLDLFDHAKDYAKIVFATTNNHRKLIEPVRRPGRLDDFISVPGLSQEEIMKIAPSCTELACRMQGWPIAYVKDMQKRVAVLGLDATKEILELERRLREARIDERKDVDQDEEDLPRMDLIVYDPTTGQLRKGTTSEKKKRWAAFKKVVGSKEYKRTVKGAKKRAKKSPPASGKSSRKGRARSP